MNPSAESQRLQAGSGLVSRVRFGLALLGLILAASGGAARAGNEPSRGAAILVYNYANVQVAVLTIAEREARKILGVTAVELEWLDCAPVSTTDQRCLRGWTKQSPGLRLITGFNKYQAREFGHADVPVLATIFYGKIVRRVHAEDADSEVGTVLGALMAHELGHLLLEDPSHSTVGVMQPDWGSAQIRSALDGKLLFTAQQATRIKQRLELRDDTERGPAAAPLNIEIGSRFENQTERPSLPPRTTRLSFRESAPCRKGSAALLE